MPYCIFDAISSLEQNLSSEELSIHEITLMLSEIVEKSRSNNKLRIITQFLVILHALSDEFQEEKNADTILSVKELVKDSLGIIRGMVDGQITHATALSLIEEKISKISSYFKHKMGTDPFLKNSILIEELGNELKKETGTLKNLADHVDASENPVQDQFFVMLYHVKRLLSFVDLIGVQILSDKLQQLIKFITEQYQKDQLAFLKHNKSFQDSLFHFYHVGSELLEYCRDVNRLTRYLDGLHYSQFPQLNEYIPNSTEQQNAQEVAEEVSEVIAEKMQENVRYTALLSSEEINALMNNDDDFPLVHFGEEFNPFDSEMIKEASQEIKTSNHPQKEITYNVPLMESIQDEDKLLHLTGKLFLKQEHIKSLIAQDDRMMTMDMTELDQLTSEIKQVLFQHYYVSMKNLLGVELREFIRKEASDHGKKLRLGIKGEDVEILSREKNFVKSIVFDLVAYSLGRSIETPSRRKALDKNESACLLIEFMDNGDHLSIYIRDDGRGISDNAEILSRIQADIVAKYGTMDVESEEHEYLKIRITLPMKKMIIKSVVVQNKDTRLLFNSKSVSQILTPSEAAVMLKKGACLGQIALSTVTGMDRSPVNAYLLFVSGNEKILIGVEKILYQTEALMEEVKVPLIPCANNVVVLRDGAIGFVMDERKVYAESKKMIEKRAEKLLENMIG
ncbi:MAG: hypothetical protein ACRCS8_03920 [Brevinema sp.]